MLPGLQENIDKKTWTLVGLKAKLLDLAGEITGLGSAQLIRLETFK